MDLSGAKKQKKAHHKRTVGVASKPVTDGKVVNHNINISISLPNTNSIKKALISLKNAFFRAAKLVINSINTKLPSKKVMNVALVAVIVASSFLLVRSVVVNNNSNNNSDEVKGIEAEKKEKPDFKVYYPAKNKKEEMSYDYKKKVASYPDQIDTIPITISQQKLPDPFKANPVVELEKLAKQINANTKLETTSVNAFMGQSVRGPQTVVFVKDQTLIFIKSDSQVAISDWNKYLDSLALQN